MRQALLGLVLFFSLNGVAQSGIADFHITPGATGSYVTFDGQGINVEVLAQIGIIVVYWYTFDPITGDLLWLVGAGSIDQDRAAISFTRVSDGTFNSGAPVTRDNAYATGTIIFDSCGGGTLEFTVPGAPAGEADFARITPDHLCESGGVRPFGSIFDGHSTGMWNNDTFGSSGAITVDIETDFTTKGSLGGFTIILDIDGNVFGLGDPDAITITGSIASDGTVSIDADSDLFGELDFDEDDFAFGKFTLTATNALGVIVFEGAFSPVHAAIVYTITVGGQVFATGTAYLNKTGG